MAPSTEKAAMAPVHGKISALPVAPRPDLKVFRPQNPYVALGLAVNHLMTKSAFANLRFGDWSRILVGQINRKHYCFAVDGNNQIQGFIGWAVTSKEKAEAWVEGPGHWPSRTAWTAIAWSSTRGQRTRAR
jgi:hemolysin-activating ACP:hemolysin acyltransferase